jgi:hypothetical protein
VYIYIYSTDYNRNHLISDLKWMRCGAIVPKVIPVGARCLAGGTLKLCAKVTCWEMAMALRRLEGTTSPMWVWSLWRSNGQVPRCGDMLSSIEPCFVRANEIAWCFMGFHGSVLFLVLFAHCLHTSVECPFSKAFVLRLSRLSHRVMKSHYFKHAGQQAN